MNPRLSSRVFSPRFLLTIACLFWIPAIHAATPIQTENAKTGTTAWQLSNPATNREIEGYASLTSVNRGGQINFYVSTTEANYRLEIYRTGWYNGAGGRLMQTAITRTGINQPMPVPDPTTGLIECRWTTPYTLTVPSTSDPTNWASGIYLVKLTALTSNKQSYIVFVVRDDSRVSDYLFQSSVTTFEAYNQWGGKSLYYGTNGPKAVKVSFNRPYMLSPTNTAAAGVGAGEVISNEAVDTVNYGAGWEINMLRFLEREGYDVTYCTDIDTHSNANLLLTHKGFLVVGHDEYWTWQMRNNIEAARDSGVSLGFFSANTCYWQVRLETSPANGAANRTMVCYKDLVSMDPILLDGNSANDYLATTLFSNAPVNRPEAALIGVSYSASPVSGDMIIYNASHWMFAGTGLTNGTRLVGLLGAEIDSLSASSPPSLAILAHSPAHADYGPYAAMTIYTAPSGATVFAAGTFQWIWGLDDYNSPMVRPALVNTAVQKATRTLLARFLNNRVPLAKPNGPYNNLAGQSVQFSGSGSTDSDGTISTYLWNFGDNSTGSGSAPTHTYSTAGVYTVTLTVSDNRGATGTATTTATISSTTSLRPVADARVRDTTATTNYGTDIELRARSSSTNTDYRSYLKFDLSPVSNTITNAKLRLYGSLNDTSSSSVPLGVYSVTSTSWTETGINWNNQPSAGNAQATVSITGTTPRNYDWDITSYVRAEKTAGRNLVSLALKATTNTSAYATFTADEASVNRPQLILTLTPPPPPTPTPTPVPTPTPAPTPPGPDCVFPCTVVLDNFNRANAGPPLSARWIEPCQVGTTGSFTIVGNQAFAQAPSSRATCWSTIFEPDMEVFARIVTPPLTAPIGVLLRMNDAGLGSLTGYAVYVMNTGTMLRIARFDSAYSGALICPDSSVTFYPGDSLGAKIIGNTITVYQKPGSGPWASIATCSDDTYSGPGAIGIDIYASGVIDDFGGGTRP